jgi:hypothetical protein
MLPVLLEVRKDEDWRPVGTGKDNGLQGEIPVPKALMQKRSSCWAKIKRW